jgi:hypothetical protein
MSCNCSPSHSQNQPPQPRFRLGHVVATRGVLSHLEHHGIAADPFLRWHVGGRRIWVITEADRSVTTLLFPSEY